MVKASCLALLGVVASLPMAGCESADSGSAVSEIEAKSQPLVGDILDSYEDPIVWAVAQVVSEPNAQGGRQYCSGTLVAPNRILTAAHCLCGLSPERIWFANPANGVPPADVWTNNEHWWPVVAMNAPANAQVCADSWNQWPNDDPLYHSPWDVAVLTIGPNGAGVLPGQQPMRVFLGYPPAALASGRLLPFAAHTNYAPWNNDRYQAVGFGNNEPLNWGVGTGSGIRRWGGYTKLSLSADPCATDPILGIPFESDCYDSPLWRAPAITDQNTLEASHGDSGGPLYFRDPVNNEIVVAGVFSHATHPSVITDEPETRTRYATTGLSADFLWESIGLPATETVANARSHVAVYTKSTAFINDRAKVIAVVDGVESGADIVAAAGPQSWDTDDRYGGARIGCDALVGSVSARRTVHLEDRCTAGNVRSGQYVRVHNNVSVASTVQGEYMRYEDFSLSPPPHPAGGPSFVVENGQTRELPPGSYGSIVVRGGGTLLIGAGLYQFGEFALNSGALVQRTETNPNARTWIFNYNDYDLRNDGAYFGGKIIADDGTLFIGVVRGRWLFISDQFDATLVAPESDVDVDNASQHASIVGSVFSRNLTLHQGGTIGFVPFTSPWVPTCTSGHTGCI